MSRQERNWQRFWKYMLIYFYALIVPVSIISAVYREVIPFQMIILAIGLPFIKNNHLGFIRKKNASV